MNPDFSVVITTFHQPAHLLKCLDALERQSLSRHQFEIIIVDDGDSPATAAAVALFTRQLNQQHGTLEIRYLPQTIRRGAAAARNRGWQAARGRIVAFTDDDCLPQPTWLAKALPYFSDETEFVAGQLLLQPPYATDPVSPSVLNFDPTSLLSANCFCVKTTLERLGGFPETAYGRQADVLFLSNLMRQAVPIKKSNDALVIHCMHDQPEPGTWFQQPIHNAIGMTDRQQVRQLWDRSVTDKQSLPVHWAAISGAFTGLMGLLTGGLLLTMAGFGIWVMLSTLFGQREQLPMRQRTPFLWAVGVRLATPFVSVYWQLHNTVKYGTMYW